MLPSKTGKVVINIEDLSPRLFFVRAKKGEYPLGCPFFVPSKCQDSMWKGEGVDKGADGDRV